MRSRTTFLGLALALVTAILLGVLDRPTWSQEPAAAKAEAPAEKAAEPAPAPAVAPAAAPAATPDPAATPTAPDSTGAGYTGANTGAALTKDGDKVTQGTLAQDVKALKMGMNIFWTLVTGFLVMFMQAGFALVETGLCRAKNAAHTMTMNFMVYGIGMIGFWICGFAIMWGGAGSIAAWDSPNILDKMFTLNIGLEKPLELFGYKGFFLSGAANDATVLTLFLFQMVFMDTTATIPTGAMAERWKFSAFVIYGFFVSMFIYPVYGAWVWGGGWLADMGANWGIGNGHIDFAGSSVVHMTGGVCALAGAWVLGARIGKFNKDGSPNAIPGHDVPMVALGTLILAFGWFGFNPGSSLAATDLRIGSVATCTMLATAAGALSAMCYMWAVFGKPDPTMCCNGLLAGAVAITAPCAFVSPVGSVIIGAIAGILVIWSVLFVERVLKIDDPVGAISVHGVNGAFGCLCIGLFADGHYGKGWNAVPDKTPTGLFYGGGAEQLLAQTIGVVANFLWVFPVSLIFFLIVEKTIGNRVSAKIEVEGLDIPEMGVMGYVNEDTIAVQIAGREQLEQAERSEPRKGNPIESRVPAGRS